MASSVILVGSVDFANSRLPVLWVLCNAVRMLKSKGSPFRSRLRIKVQSVVQVVPSAVSLVWMGSHGVFPLLGAFVKCL